MAAIGKIRNMSWLLVGIMVISLIAFLLMGIGGKGNARVRQTDELAIVDGEAISNQTFNEKVVANALNYKNQRQIQTLSDADMNGIKASTYNQMVNEKIFEKIFEKTGITVSNAEFIDMLSGKHIHPGIKNSFKDEAGNFDVNLFTNYIDNLNVENSPEDEPGTKRKAWKAFETGIVKERLTKKYNNLIEKSMTVPTFMAKDEYAKSKNQVSFDYVKVPYSSIADSSLNLTDKDLNDYIKNHSKEYQQDENVDIKFASFPIIASENDRLETLNWITEKTKEWEETPNDSSFVSLYSETPYDGSYYGINELNNIYKDTMFHSEIGTIYGPNKIGNGYTSYKLLDKKMIADSLKARHLLISFKEVKTQEEAAAKRALFDSLYTLVDSTGVALSSLTAQYSDDKSNALNGGDLNWVKPNAMVKPFNDLIFFKMKEGDVKMVATEFGLHIVEVYKANLTKEAVKIATLSKEILASGKTQNDIYANASRFSGNNNTPEKFKAAEETTIINPAIGILKDANTIQRIQGNARQIVKWAFNATVGEVSSPFTVGDAYYVALVVNKNAKGTMTVNDNNRLRISAAAAKDKKADLIKGKMTGSDLNTIASSNNVSIASAQNLSFGNTNVGTSREPKIVGVALGLNENTVSKTIQGNDGVYVINVTAKVIAPEDETAINNLKATLKTQNKTAVTSTLSEAVKKSVKIVDNRFDFF